MRITKLDPYNVDEPKVKNRASSSSQEKGLGMKKKLPLNSLAADHFNGQQKNVALYEDNNADGNTQTIQINRDGSSPTNYSKKALLGQMLYRDQTFKQQLQKDQTQKESFLDFLQNQMRNQEKQSNKTKLKLPMISNTKQAITPSTFSMDDDHANLTSPPDSTKPQTTKNSQQSQLASKLQSKQNPIFINIKAVIPIEKTITSNKKKQHSLRDLRIMRKQNRQSVNDDYVVQSNEAQNNQNSRSKVNSNSFSNGTALLRKNLINTRESPLKLTTGDKKRSHRTSQQKISSAINNRDKRSFSINTNKKKYAATYTEFCSFVSSLNKIKVVPQPVVLYRAFVGKGNNSILVKTAIKNRFWWNIVAEKTKNDEVNFVWLQQRDNQFIGELGSTVKNDLRGSPGTGSQKDLAVKRQKYHLQAKPEEKQNPYREFVRYGFSRLLSEKQSKQNNFTALYAQTLLHESLPQPSFDPQKIRIHNHLQFNWNLTNKKALFYNLKTYYELIKEDPFKYIPLTFHVKEVGDQSWQEFKQTFQTRLKQCQALNKDLNQGKKKKKEKKQKGTLPLWIIKPGQNSNQGCGIQVSDNLQQIIQIVKQKTQTGKNRSSIIQRYLMPFLYNKRKFDIRCYMLATCVKGTMKGYWYEQGYIRTSSKEFTTKNLKNRMIHLTNDAVQKKGEDYGKYENGNKISFADFQKYLDNNFGDKKLNFYKTVYPQMMRLARDALTATCHVLDEKKREFTFEVFGLDFMIDDEFNTWLIQVNNNPCLELSSPLLARIIPNMIENAFKIAIDPLFPPPLNIPKTKNLPSDLFESNKFTLIFNSGDIEEGFQHEIQQNKINLDLIIEGQDQDEELLDDEEDCCGQGEKIKGKQPDTTSEKTADAPVQNLEGKAETQVEK